MISKVEARALLKGAAITNRPKLSAVERGLLKWAVVDQTDKVLDANIGEGFMAEYLKRNMQCEVCGMSESMEDVNRARRRLQNADIVYASTSDIPWHEGAFDTVLFKFKDGEYESLRKAISEIKRVLKAGGQLLLGMNCYHSMWHFIPRPFIDADFCEQDCYFLKDVILLLREADFENLSWQRTGIKSHVMIAWKKRVETEAHL
ncbi:MAG: methyltransferase domain-containing protein [Clostridia bacterium]